jgi:diacylglycerol kinase family enzyme
VIRRAAAALSLLALLAAIVVVLVAIADRPGAVIGAAVLVVVLTMAAWYAAVQHGVVRAVAALVAAAALVGLILLLLDHPIRLIVAIALVVAATALARVALGRDLRTLKATATPGRPVGPARRGVLIMNPKSGGGKVETWDLARVAEERGIEPVVLHMGDDLQELAREAVRSGADVIGMAGGDGSQALVAEVAMEHDVGYVCIPAGTRNHLALDLGLDREDVVGALDAFGEAYEQRIDLARVGDRIFVNNVSLGVYAEAVQSEGYRDAKIETITKTLPELLGPGRQRPGLRFDGPDGSAHPGADVILVSNNPYRLARLDGFGTRSTLGSGQLGVVAVRIEGAGAAARLVTLQTVGKIRRFPGWAEWPTEQFTIASDAPIPLGVDGEALILPGPLVFTSLPAALRVRLPKSAPGLSPAARAVRPVRAIPDLLRTIWRGTAGH